MKQTVIVLGSTGSIGKQTLDVLQMHRDRFTLLGIAADRDSELLRFQAAQWKPSFVACRQKADRSAYPDQTELLTGSDAAQRLAAIPCDIVVLAISGFAALKPLLAAIPNGKRIAIANKESLVCGGELVQEALNRSGAELVPIDSEQSALFQCLQNGRKSEVRRLILTASGGPFFRKTREECKDVSMDQVLKHPTWSMGRKITLDSATLFNKGLEVIEASRLFGFGPDAIDVLIHPQSIVHSMVEYCDGSIIANLAVPDMRLPIQYALTYPERIASPANALNLAAAHDLTFYAADRERFVALQLAYDALSSEGGCPIVYNGANEQAAAFYFEQAIGFLDIEACVQEALAAYAPHPIQSIEEIFSVDAQARASVRHFVERMKR
ncbi:MAG: 1-deoxy-D-xylulose-5-phosphate reductoisomerase [Clostridia bacterium]|nr:1-deoxy-D-xylulose-5-phosphate reductoisomerase [Clostridia bacterium]